MKRRITLTVLIALTVALVSLPIFGVDSFSGKVKSVKDGDTIVISNKGEWVTVNLAGIHTPTRGQEFGEEARDYLTEIAKKKAATVEVTQHSVRGHGSSIRYVAFVTVDGRDLSTAMIEAGYAWPTSAAGKSQLAAAEKAKASKSGVYSESFEAGS